MHNETEQLRCSPHWSIGWRSGQSRPNVGEAVIPVEITDEMMEGVISIPHGFGHIYDDSQQTNAADIIPGVSCKDLIDESLDIASSTCVVNGVPVHVYPEG